MNLSKNLLSLGAALLAAQSSVSAQETPVVIPVYDHVVFYDGYRMKDNPDSLLNDGVIRHSCSLYSKKLTDTRLDAIGDSLKMNVFVTACCDNYDRIGNINLAFTSKGVENYIPEETPRIELGRFITPFMDKNKEPSTVPYSYDMAYMSLLLRDKDIREKYDLWLEFELFGIPYAANEQIEGCEGRSDVFQGTLEFETTQPASPTQGNILVPIVIKKPEYLGGNLNNYNEEATDTLGLTTKTYFFDVPEDVADSQIVLVTSNHGANTDGEEYNRRWHYVYVDDELLLTYRPGRKSCEPFREYNTQPNGIYGYYEKNNLDWQIFSNWCPGDVIDNRIISLGAMKAGTHKLRISVPTAVFPGKQGDIPVSAFFHGLKEGTINAGIFTPQAISFSSKAYFHEGCLIVEADEAVKEISVYSVNGEKLYSSKGNDPIPVDMIGKGIKLVNVTLDKGIIETHKIKSN